MAGYTVYAQIENGNYAPVSVGGESEEMAKMRARECLAKRGFNVIGFGDSRLVEADERKTAKKQKRVDERRKEAQS